MTLDKFEKMITNNHNREEKIKKIKPKSNEEIIKETEFVMKLFNENNSIIKVKK